MQTSQPMHCAVHHCLNVPFGCLQAETGTFCMRWLLEPPGISSQSTERSPPTCGSYRPLPTYSAGGLGNASSRYTTPYTADAPTTTEQYSQILAYSILPLAHCLAPQFVFLVPPEKKNSLAQATRPQPPRPPRRPPQSKIQNPMAQSRVGRWIHPQ